jgi:hypothetical protein
LGNTASTPVGAAVGGSDVVPTGALEKNEEAEEAE